MLTQDEINKESKNAFLRGEIENRRDFSVGFKAAQSKMYSEEDMINFAWWLSNNVGLYSSDEVAHFEGEYLKKWKKL